MGKTKFKTIKPEDVAAAEEIQAGEEQEEQYLDASVQKVFELLKGLNISGGGCRCYLKRPGSIKAGYIGEMTVEQFMQDGLETLKSKFGGGDYTFQFTDSSGQFLKQASLFVDPSFKGIEPPAPAVPGEKDEERIDKIVERLKPPPQDTSLLQIMMTMVTTAQQATQATQQNMMLMMAENQKSMVGLMTAIAAAGEKKGTDPALLELIKQKTDKTPLTETIEAMTMLAEMQNGGGGKEKEDMVEKFIKLAGPTLVNFLTTRMAMPPLPPPQMLTAQELATATGAAQGGGPPPPPTAVSAAPASESNGPGPKLSFFIPMLLNAARKGTEPAAYYEVICDNISEDQLDKLVDELETPGWFESLFGTHEQVVAQKAWLEKLRLVFLEEPEAEATEKQEAGK